MVRRLMTGKVQRERLGGRVTFSVPPDGGQAMVVYPITDYRRSVVKSQQQCITNPNKSLNSERLNRRPVSGHVMRQKH